MCGDEGGEVPAGFTPWSRWLTLTRKTLAPFRTSTVVDNSWRGDCSCLRSPMRTEGRARKAVWGIPHTRPHTNDLQFPLAITLLQISHNWLWTELYAGVFFLSRKAIVSQRKRSSRQLQTGHVSEKSIIVDPATVQDCKVASLPLLVPSFLSGFPLSRCLPLPRVSRAPILPIASLRQCQSYKISYAFLPLDTHLFNFLLSELFQRKVLWTNSGEHHQ